MINSSIKKLVNYGIHAGLLAEEDRIYTTNLLLERLNLSFYEEPTENEMQEGGQSLFEILKELLDYAFEQGVIEDNGVATRDLFDTKLMNCLMPRPGEVISEFYKRYQDSPKCATDYFYKLSQDSDYIRRYRIEKDVKWKTPTPYGELDITINLSKPEKDPKAIEAARNAKQTGYPKCLLCMENEGYAGHLSHPARENHRIIPITINNQKWGFQYSPYVYYNEHCIVFNGEHTPMRINRQVFEKLFDFIRQFPHYCVGSNADLPIVGGSILSHDHFQGGNYEFPMAKTPYLKKFTVKDYEDVECGIIQWPLSVIRIRHQNQDRLIDLADHILTKWRAYTDENAMIFARTDGEPHNTITPIARHRQDCYELDLTLRNNLTTREHPLGLYHPHQELHHIKKENIGLIEVMGLAILPARLKEELALLEEYISSNKDIRSNEKIEKHADWVESFLPTYGDLKGQDLKQILQKETGIVFMHVLEDAGVFKQTEKGISDFERFTDSL